MSVVIASQIPFQVDESEIEKFFQFCGKIKSLEIELTIDAHDNKFKKAIVEFESKAAVSTAILLNGAELGGKPITVTAASDDSEEPVLKTVPGDDGDDENVGVVVSDNNVSGSDGIDPDSDAPQELKPKAAIVAQYLSQGYVLSDSLIEKAIDFDKQHGISQQFNDFLNNVDKRYHVQEKTSEQIHEADTKLGIEEKLEKGKHTLASYIDKFKKDPYGSRIHKFYLGVITDAKQIHEEAKRLAELRKSQAEPESRLS
ncbi:BA75_02178T0 [Komagataella pastoris]|uniref:BA75_02178T0 n=1 Tax=Komagataella pastoris TaxID=4922 RepID=A0A1B2JAT9_PICPA|nr:BA75_02178T0 [Komagataella pastoris]